MSEPLLDHYNRELDYIRRLGAEFARENPLIAGRLGLGPSGTVEDPHVARLIESFAFISARTRQKLEDDFPELTSALLGVLYPHYLAPLPSMAIARFDAQPELTSGHTLPRHTLVETDPVDGEPCLFRTGYPVTLWPIGISDAALVRRPFSITVPPGAQDAVAVLRLVLDGLSKDVSFAELQPESLRLFISAPVPACHHLYELLVNNVLEVAVATGPDDKKPIPLGADAIQPVGFGRDELLLPVPARSFSGYSILTEFFVFREKFLFVDIAGIDRRALRQIGNHLELYLYLRGTAQVAEQDVTPTAFSLGCTPIVNLFEHRADPIQLDDERHEYRVVPDSRRQQATEVYAIQAVHATRADGSARAFHPLYGFTHGVRDHLAAGHWVSVRRPAPGADPGTDVFIQLVDSESEPMSLDEPVLSVETLCTNRDLPSHLPFGGGQPRLALAEGGAPIAGIACLTKPTRTVRPSLGHGTMWRLISHLSLNHLSITGADDGAAALREIMALYDFRDSDETRAWIDGISSVTSSRVLRRVRSEGRTGMANGLEVRVTLRPERFAAGGLFVFASVLERFLGLYAHVNGFTQMVLSVEGQEGEVRRWAPRAGDRPLL